jgi:hypothetical protein
VKTEVWLRSSSVQLHRWRYRGGLRPPSPNRSIKCRKPQLWNFFSNQISELVLAILGLPDHPSNNIRQWLSFLTYIWIIPWSQCTPTCTAYSLSVGEAIWYTVGGFVLVEYSIIFYPSSRMRMSGLTYGWVSGKWASRLKGGVALNIYWYTNEVAQTEVCLTSSSAELQSLAKVKVRLTSSSIKPTICKVIATQATTVCVISTTHCVASCTWLEWWNTVMSWNLTWVSVRRVLNFRP